MTDHPKTATDRFLRHGVAGGFNGHTSYRDKMTSDDWEAQVGVIARELMKDIHALLLNPALWEAAGRSLGWKESRKIVTTNCVYDNCYSDEQSVEDFAKGNPKIYEELLKSGKETEGSYEYRLYDTTPEWVRRWHGLLDHLAAHPGDVEGYLATLLDANGN